LLDLCLGLWLRFGLCWGWLGFFLLLFRSLWLLLNFSLALLLLLSFRFRGFSLLLCLLVGKTLCLGGFLFLSSSPGGLLFFLPLLLLGRFRFLCGFLLCFLLRKFLL
jgi:hypothetical protein